MLKFLKRSIRQKEISGDFRRRIVMENSRWSFFILNFIAASQIILLFLEAIGVLPWNPTTLYIRLAIFITCTLFSILLKSAGKSKDAVKYLGFIMILLHLITLVAGVFLVLYFLQEGNFSFTIYLLVVFILSISYIVRPCYLALVYILAFLVMIAHINATHPLEFPAISEIITTGIFLLMIAIGSSFGHARYWKLYKQEKEIEEINRKLEMISQTDELTGLFNRRRFTEELVKQLDLSQRYKSVFSLAILDIDHFKNVNDTYGHSAGDDILHEFSGLLKSKLRTSDTFGRWGGEEFILLLPNTTPIDAKNLLIRLQKEISEYKFVNNISIQFSAGVCGYADQKDFNQIVNCADTALYNAKENGRNRTEVFNDISYEVK